MRYGTLQPRKCGAEVQLEFKFRQKSWGIGGGGGERESRGINELPK